MTFELKLRSKAYKSWMKMREGCRNEGSNSYHNYGAKGINVSDEFYNDFSLFLSCVGLPPALGREWSIDRVNSLKGYERGNICWVDRDTQSKNKSIYSNSPTGKSGIQWYFSGNKRHSTYCITTWRDLDGQPKNKKFSVNQVGLMPALATETKFRFDKIEELKSLGVKYSTTHGITTKGISQ